MTEKKKSTGAARQQKLRARRAAEGRVRKEYWATPGEHKALAVRLQEVRKDAK